MSSIIFWDWDNTLVDTFQAILTAQNALRLKYGLKPWTREESKLAMNQSGRNLIKNLVGADKEREARSYFLECYAQNLNHLILKEGAAETLNRSKSLGYVNILASNKEKKILDKEVEILGINALFDRIIGANQAPEDKPSKIFSDKAIEGLEVEKILSVGDGLSDIKMAHNYPNGQAILVFSDVNSKEFQNEKPDYVAANLFECQKILLSVSKSVVFDKQRLSAATDRPLPGLDRVDRPRSDR